MDERLMKRKAFQSITDQVPHYYLWKHAAFIVADFHDRKRKQEAKALEVSFIVDGCTSESVALHTILTILRSQNRKLWKPGRVARETQG